MNQETNQTTQNTIKPMEKPFLETKPWFRKEQQVEKLQEFVLLLMKNNGHSDFIEGQQAGEFYIKSADGKQEKSIMLTPKKLTTFNYNGQYFKGWIAHEDNMSPYPQDPLHNGEMFRKTIQKVSMNYRDANEAKFLEAKTKMWIWIILIGLLVTYVIYIFASKSGWIGGTPTPPIQAVQAAATATGVSVG